MKDMNVYTQNIPYYRRLLDQILKKLGVKMIEVNYEIMCYGIEYIDKEEIKDTPINNSIFEQICKEIQIIENTKTIECALKK